MYPQDTVLCGKLPSCVPMTSEEHIRALSLKVIAAPSDSEEFTLAIAELRAALDANATRGREKIAALKQKTFPHSEDVRGG
jgi:hypothetical protein